MLTSTRVLELMIEALEKKFNQESIRYPHCPHIQTFSSAKENLMQLLHKVQAENIVETYPWHNTGSLLSTHQALCDVLIAGNALDEHAGAIEKELENVAYGHSHSLANDDEAYSKTVTRLLELRIARSIVLGILAHKGFQIKISHSA